MLTDIELAEIRERCKTELGLYVYAHTDMKRLLDTVEELKAESKGTSTFPQMKKLFEEANEENKVLRKALELASEDFRLANGQVIPNMKSEYWIEQAKKEIEK